MYEGFAEVMGTPDVRVVVRCVNDAGETVFERAVSKNDAQDETGEQTEAAPVTLEEYVYSGTFQDSLSAQGSEVLSIWAEVEDENVMVIWYEYAQPLSDAQKSALQEGLAADADGSLAAGARELLEMVRAGVSTPDISLVYRWTDPTGETLAERQYR